MNDFIFVISDRLLQSANMESLTVWLQEEEAVIAVLDSKTYHKTNFELDEFNSAIKNVKRIKEEILMRKLEKDSRHKFRIPGHSPK